LRRGSTRAARKKAGRIKLLGLCSGTGKERRGLERRRRGGKESHWTSGRQEECIGLLRRCLQGVVWSKS